MTRDNGALILPSAFTLLHNGLQVTGKPPFAQWEAAGAFLRRAEGAVQWWIGDWLNIGEQRYGETYTQALEETGRREQTLRLYKMISSRFELLTRVNNLTWEHHRCVAALPMPEAKRFLVKAEQNGWSAAQLRREAKQSGLASRRIAAASAARETARKAAAESGEESPAEEEGAPVVLQAGDFREVLANMDPGSVDLIFTDPPYDRDNLHLYFDLARLACRVLKDGGSLFAYAGHYALGDIITGMEAQGLRYWWTMAVLHSGGNARLPGKWVFVGWKPLVWFVQGRRRDDKFISDVITSASDFQADGGDKDLHEWQQSEKEAAYLIGELTVEKEVVLDPMCGSGTTLAAAHRLGRVAVGVDVDPDNIEITRSRILVG